MLSQKMNGSQLTSLAAVLFADGLLNREMSSQENKELTFVRTKYKSGSSLKLVTFQQ